MTVAALITTQIRQERKCSHDSIQGPRKDNYCIADPSHMFCLFHWKRRSKALVISDRAVHSLLPHLCSVYGDPVTVAAVRAAHGNISGGIPRFIRLIPYSVGS